MDPNPNKGNPDSAVDDPSGPGPSAVRGGGMHVLDMGNNSIGREGASALAKYMAKSKTLKELNLYMNDVGTAGITEVRTATVNPRLE